ncbi:hypothetical protein Vretimale_19754 [Volvox reticuliferus]|uniref:Uncharacterized protein n=1 Tax=Volvox reticuliferus TaxID=1737510 RepID=A0A8J4H0Q4_9CHLO|nr:hypothetical protein Vretifemale_20744 [Volvox reticuliferus]GIM17249.1 hypothetical protein Vretimale_19754 [Volvox reticuliferus]
MPSAALQKLASGLSSGGTGANDHGTTLSNRGGGSGGGGGVIRGLFQSLRAGLSTETGSPRHSRNGFADGQSTPRGGHGQNTNSTNLDVIRVDSDVSDAEDSRSRLLSSGASGYAGYPSVPRTPTSSDNGHIVLPLEVSMAASRSYSGRRSVEVKPARAASSSRPSFEAAKIEASATSYKVHSAGHCTVSGPTPLAETAKLMLTQSLQLQSSFFQASVTPPASAGALVQPGHQEHVWTASASAKSLTLDASREQQIPALEVSTAKTTPQESLTKAPSLAATAAREVQPSKPMSNNEGQHSKLAAKLRAFRPSFRKRLLEATTGSGAAQVSQPVATQVKKDPPDGSSSDASGDSGDGVEAAIVGVSVDGGDSCAAGVAAPTVAAAAGVAVIDAVNGHTIAPGAAMGLSTSDTIVLQHQGLECQEQHQEQQQRHCRSSSTNELSAMAVSQAVQRLQMRQQQEKAAARFSRSSQHLPAGGAGGGGGGSGLHNQYNTMQQPYHGHGQRDVVSSPAQHVMSAVSDVSSNGTSANSTTGGGTGASAPHGESGIAGLPSPQVHSQSRMSPARRLGLVAPQARSSTGSYAFQYALYDAHRTAANGGADAQLFGSHVSGDTEDKGGLDEWLGGDVPDMSRGRVLRAPAADLDRKSSMSCTEGRISAAGRLQAMVTGAASAGGDEAASFLQQLLLPEVPSTASVDLQYSNASTRVPSVVALAYGSSGGPAAGGGALGAPAGGLWGLLQASSSPFGYGGYGEMYPPTSPAPSTTTANTVAAAAGLGGGGAGGKLRHSSGQGHSQYGGPASFSGNSGPGSRPGSGILNSQTAPTSLFGGAQTYSSAGGIGVGIGGSATSVSDTFSSMPDLQGSADPHANKTAAQLVEELRELHTAPAGAPKAAVVDPSLQPPSRRSLRPASSGAIPAANAAARGREVGNRSCSGGLGEPVMATAAAPGDSSVLHHQQLRDELVAALWRMLRAKNSEAVSYLLAVDPASKANGPIAPMLKEMRSWVYLNMW